MLAVPGDREALEAVLIRNGVRLRDAGNASLSWRDVVVLARQSPRLGDWTRTDYLLAELVDLTSWLAWAKTEDAAKGRNRPKPIPRPGDEPPERLGSESMSFAEADKWLGWTPAAPDTTDDDGS